MHSEIEEIFLKEKLILGVKEAQNKIHRVKWGEFLGEQAKISTRVPICQ